MAKRSRGPERTVTPQVLESLRPRFDAIGPWRIATADDGVDIEWDQPPALADLGFRVELEFIVETESGNLDPDDRMLDLWQRFYEGRHRHAAHFREHLVALYREHQPSLIEQDRFPADLSDEEVMRMVRGTVTIRRQE